ncbi:hypothetical protein TNCT_733641 [Trichonephila clavata]|uniref:Uncharacterized protein n=1 Tax=Trichonephila clavata TaxID=2740835 RepID=A0A8X6L594_TRICU|nr:hypothetical protein TNCT_733641 [Trichonephila clavata]
MFHKPPQRLDGGDIGGPSRDHPNARLVGPELCSESFHSTENVMLRLNQCFAYTPPRPDGRVMGGPCRVHQNATLLGPRTVF